MYLSLSRLPARLLLLLGICLPGLLQPVLADIVKPALVEISINTDATYRIEVRASIEALLTGINSRYRNTTQAPTAQAYDDLRVLQADQLAAAFEPFKEKFTRAVSLRFDGAEVPLSISKVQIPEPGYTKVPRISVIILAGAISRDVKQISWYYPARFGDNAVRVRQVDEANEKWHWSEWQWIRDDRRSEPFSLSELFTITPFWEVVRGYLVAGFEHIVPLGLDHILFILGIFLLSTHWRPLLEQVTMFTVAHTITLGLSMNGIIELSARVVEPLIALSIAWIAFENVFSSKLHRYRLGLVFGFGLLHGLGFASVLADFGLPADRFATALISFNVGVEFGQLFIISLAYASVGFWFGRRDWYRSVVVVPASLLIGLVGLYWTYDRIVI